MLKEVCYQDRQIIEPDSEEAASRPYLSLEHIESNTGRILRESSESKPGEGKSTTFAFDPRHVLYGKLRPYLNKVALPDFAGRCTTELIPLLPNESTMNRDFLAFLLRRKETVAAATLDKTGSRMPRANMEALLRLSVPLPPLAEQRRMAGRLREQLAALAQARAAVQAQLDAAQALPAAHLRAVFNSSAAQRWPMSKLGELAEVSGGIQKTPDRAPRQFHKQFLTVRNVQRGFLDLTRVERFEVTPAEFARCRLERGDILIVEGNGSVDHIGRNALFDQDGEWIHQNHIIRVRLSGDHFQPEFVSLFLNSEAGRKQMLEKAKSTTGLYTLSTSKVASLEIPTAPLGDQRAISARLEGEKKEAASLTETLSEKLTALDHLPAALLREAFGDNAGKRTKV